MDIMQRKSELAVSKYARAIEKFLDSNGPRNLWIDCRPLRLYMRKGLRYLGDHKKQALDFAALSVAHKLPGVTGPMNVLWAVQAMEQVCDKRKLILYVECVHEPGLFKFFERRAGYEQVGEKLNHSFAKFS